MAHRRAALCALLLLLAPAAQAQPKPPVPSMLVWTPEQQLKWYPAIETVFPVRVVPRGPKVRELPKAEHEIAVAWTDAAGKAWTLDSYMAAYRTSGVIVLHDGKIVLERYALGRKPTDRWTSMSVAKSVTSLLAGAAIQDGKLKLDDPVERFVPELKGSGYDGVTVRQLLMMSSGVRWNEAYEDPNSDLARMARVAADQDPLLKTLASLPREHTPGSTFHYNTAETHLAGLVVSRAVGKPLADYLSEKIWKPFGMERDAAWMVDAQGREAAGCCLSMTLRDYARVGQFALENGVAGGKAVLPPTWIAESTRVQIPNGQPAPNGYGYFWWIGARAYEASGINGQSILVYPKERIVIAVNSAWPRPDAPELFRALGRFQQAVYEAVTGKP